MVCPLCLLVPLAVAGGGTSAASSGKKKKILFWGGITILIISIFLIFYLKIFTKKCTNCKI